jgi:hypothetical protein
MLAVNQFRDPLKDSSESALWEIHSSKISLHHAKTGYNYPTIRLPHTFSQLAGLSTRIYQTIYDGSLAFLTVISPTENASKTPESSVFTRRHLKFESRLGKDDVKGHTAGSYPLNHSRPIREHYPIEAIRYP